MQNLQVRNCDSCWAVLTAEEVGICDKCKAKFDREAKSDEVVCRIKNLSATYQTLSTSEEYIKNKSLPWRTISKALREAGLKIGFNYYNPSSHCVEIGCMMVVGWASMINFRDPLLKLIQLHDAKAEFAYFRGTSLWLARFRMRTIRQMQKAG